ncbi:MAG: ATP-binding protein, partial [Nostoc sp.]
MNTYTVIMLGPSGSGKTVFLASMYKKLSTQGEHGFFLDVDGAEKRKRLNNIYTQIAVDDKWPKGTTYSEISEWTFTCRVQTENLPIYSACKFAYLDYAGGRLTDEMEEEDTAFESK